MMNKKLACRRLSAAVSLVALASLITSFACRSPLFRRGSKLCPPTLAWQESLEARKARLCACAKRLASRSDAPLQSLELPSEDVVQAMGADERVTLALGASYLLDRFQSMGKCSAAEVEWLCQTLVLLRFEQGKEAERVLRSVAAVPLQEIFSLEKLNQWERLVRAAYSELVRQGEAEPANFERSPLKKAIIRRQLYLLRGRENRT